jgi:Glycosyl transferase family 90
MTRYEYLTAIFLAMIPVVLLQWNMIRQVHREEGSHRMIQVDPMSDNTRRLANQPLSLLHHYPVWNDAAVLNQTARHYFDHDNVTGIDIQHQIVHFAQLALLGQASTTLWGKSRRNFPEILYVMDSRGVHVSRTLRDRSWPVQIPYRVQPTEGVMNLAYQRLTSGMPKKKKQQQNNASRKSPSVLASPTIFSFFGQRTTRGRRRLQEETHHDSKGTPQQRWPSLYQAVVEHGTGIPFLVWYGDYKSCPTHQPNWLHTVNLNAKGIPVRDYFQKQKRRNATAGAKAVTADVISHPRYQRVPLFTTCARVNCQHALPLPTYKTIRDSRAQSSDWDAVHADYRARYPWNTKRRQLVWRGSLSGDLPETNSSSSGSEKISPRWLLGQTVTRCDKKSRAMFDVGLVGIPSRHDNVVLDLTQVGGLKKSIQPMENFMKYQAILDIDGNSWSSRFGTLLCYNSVVLKVEPHYVDYFHFRDLQPYVHYVPVHYNLSDLVAQTAWTLDPANQAAVQEIVRHANQWCRHRMVWSSIAEDYLDILEEYTTFLNQAQPNFSRPESNSRSWNWAAAKAEIFRGSRSTGFDMVPVTHKLNREPVESKSRTAGQSKIPPIMKASATKK